MQASPATIVAPSVAEPSDWSRTGIAVRGILILGWLVVLAVGACIGERHSTYASLEDAVRAGHVHTVQVTDDHPVSRGRITVEVFWRRGPLRYTTSVLESRSGGTTGGDVTAAVPVAVAEELRGMGADVQLRPPTAGWSATMLGWRLPGWSAGLFLTLAIATALLFFASPEPWLATRWAWFWLIIGAAPVGLIAYLALAGPVPFRRPLSRRRLTGGYGFLLALGVSIVVAYTRAVVQ